MNYIDLLRGIETDNLSKYCSAICHLSNPSKINNENSKILFQALCQSRANNRYFERAIDTLVKEVFVFMENDKQLHDYENSYQTKGVFDNKDDFSNFILLKHQSLSLNTFNRQRLEGLFNRMDQIDSSHGVLRALCEMKENTCTQDFFNAIFKDFAALLQGKAAAGKNAEQVIQTIREQGQNIEKAAV